MSARTGFRGSRLAFAVALPLPPLAWYGAQRGLEVLVGLRCSIANETGAAVGGLSFLVCAVAVWLAGPSRSGGDSPAAQTDRVLRWFVLLGAGLFGLAIVFQTLASLIVPSCAR